MQPDFPRAAQHGKEQSFAAKQGRLDIPGLLHIELNRLFKSDHAPRVDVQHFTGLQYPFHNRPAGVHENHAGSFEFLHDEAFAAEQSGHDLALKIDADRNAPRRTQETILLADQHAAHIGQLHRNNVAGIRRAKGDMGLALPAMRKNGDKQTFAGQEPFPRPQNLVHESALGSSARSIAKQRVHFHARRFVHHRPGLGDRALAGIQFHFHELHLGTDNFVIHFIGNVRTRNRPPTGISRRCAKRRRRRLHHSRRRHRRRQFRHLLDRQPLGKSVTPRQPVGIGLRLRPRLRIIQGTDLLTVIRQKPRHRNSSRKFI